MLSYQLEKNPVYEEIITLVSKNAWIAGVKHAIKQRYEVSYLRTKLLFVGRGKAGKTTTINSLLKKEHNARYLSTLVG